MGGASGGGNSGGENTGADEGFFISEQEKKRKKNQKNLADHEKNMRDNRGGNTKIIKEKPVSVTSSPTTMEIDQAQSTQSTQSTDKTDTTLMNNETTVKNNKKGRTENILTSAAGLGDNNLVIKKKKLGAA